MEGRVALVTGASAGIGLEAVQALLSQGMTVVGCARRHELIVARREAHKERMHARRCDLSDAGQVADLFQWIDRTFGRLDVCVINGGTTGCRSLLDADAGTEWRNMLDVNVLAASLCAQLSVRLMLERKVSRGHLVFMNSMSGHAVHPHPVTRFYSATKFAVTALVEAWRAEVKALPEDESRGLRVSSISPRLVQTEFPYLLYPGQPEKADAIVNSVKCLQPEDVAEALVHILAAPPHVEMLDVQMQPTQKKY